MVSSRSHVISKLIFLDHGVSVVLKRFIGGSDSDDEFHTGCLGRERKSPLLIVFECNQLMQNVMNSLFKIL